MIKFLTAPIDFPNWFVLLSLAVGARLIYLDIRSAARKWKNIKEIRKQTP